MNQEQALKLYPNRKEHRREDEIDLYDLMDILVKQKFVILITWILVVLLSLGGAFYIRDKNYKKMTLNFKIENQWKDNPYFISSGLKVNFIDYKEILENKKYVDELFEVSGIKNLYEKQFDNEDRGFSNQIKFLKENIVITPVVIKSLLDNNQSILDHYSITTDFKGNTLLGKEVIDKYFNILENENLTLLNNSLREDTPRIKKNMTESNEKLDLLEEKIREVSERELKLIQGKDINLESLMNLKYQKLLIEKRQESSIYERSRGQLKALEELKKEMAKDKPTILKASSFMEIKNKSKALLILVVGIILGLFTGIFMAFINELIEEYKKRKI